MDYAMLLDMAMEVGYRLAMCGAETYRIEESVNRILAAYGIQAETFAIPNCLHASILDENGSPITRMRRIGYHGSDLDSVEKFSNLSRRICLERPAPDVIMKWIRDTESSRRKYNLLLHLLGSFLGACGFAVLFGAGITDCLLSGVCGIVIGLVNLFMDKQKANQFFRILIAAYLMAFTAYLLGALNIAANTDAVIIGALMHLVPGLLFTNAMRDIMYGDTNSGINRIVQVLLIAVSIAVGTAAAFRTFDIIGFTPKILGVFSHNLWAELLGCFIGCTGFFILFNIHGPGGFLCSLGGVLCWFTYRVPLMLGLDSILAYFISAFVVCCYCEIMARVRKYPAISYLVISIFPIIPGAGVYYAMTYAMQGDTAAFADKGLETAAIAGVMAAGILISTTLMRLITGLLTKKK